MAIKESAPQSFRTPSTADGILKKRSRSYDDDFAEDEPAISRQATFARESRSTSSACSSSNHYIKSVDNSGALSRNSD